MTPTSLRLLTGVGLALSIVWPAHAASDAQKQYEAQKAACNAGTSTQDKATCLKEAGAAFEEAKRNRLDNGDADLRKDAMDRCKALTGSDQRDCIARMKGGGTVSGSVAGGGILREKVTKEVVRPAQVVPAAPPASGGN